MFGERQGAPGEPVLDLMNVHLGGRRQKVEVSRVCGCYLCWLGHIQPHKRQTVQMEMHSQREPTNPVFAVLGEAVQERPSGNPAAHHVSQPPARTSAEAPQGNGSVVPSCHRGTGVTTHGARPGGPLALQGHSPGCDML